ncbi:hypothetical protein Taro_015686 [Colocasia esculenta]|uniref:Outer envelope membrane protein 7 n=1 Tax=Colocasia esculenta TaxID=4460 RepID=A0A843UI75_COLES|nr:hypothetical protein [Colocasia esculenta]
MGQQRSSGFKSALVVAGGLAFAWLTIEMAFKPFLDRLRDSVAKSDPGRDPDGDGEDAGETSEPSSFASPSSEEGQAGKHEK